MASGLLGGRGIVVKLGWVVRKCRDRLGIRRIPEKLDPIELTPE
jgi:hypothetical protein